MEPIQYVRKTDLARNTRKVIRDVQRGQTAVVESHGQPEVAIIDIVDYYLQRAALNYYAKTIEITEEGLSDEVAAQAEGDQELYNLVLAYYLSEAISLGRAAELLDLSYYDLRLRCSRLGIPMRLGPTSIEEAKEEIRNAELWANRSRQ